MAPLNIIIIDKGGELKTTTVKNYKECELYKKCGFKKDDGFSKQIEWVIKIDGEKYIISMYGKLNGKANMENKYDFPPPVDTKLYFGSCALVCEIIEGDNSKTLCNIYIPLWNKMYDKLFGGFENLSTDIYDDENEIDELAILDKTKKTKIGGYLKDGFVVDSTTDDDDDDDIQNDEDISDDSLIFEDIVKELNEEDYDYSDDDK